LLLRSRVERRSMISWLIKDGINEERSV